jgi:hypothetical protein
MPAKTKRPGHISSMIDLYRADQWQAVQRHPPYHMSLKLAQSALLLLWTVFHLVLATKTQYKVLCLSLAVSHYSDQPCYRPKPLKQHVQLLATF